MPLDQIEHANARKKLADADQQNCRFSESLFRRDRNAD
jgi:hypothetical protein